jgi:TolA-binding protein
VPVFYPGEKVLLPQSQLGVGRAHFGMENFKDAKAALNELIATYAASREATQAKVELEKIARREKALAAPK